MIDPNVLISAFITSGGPTAAVLDAVRSRRLGMVGCPRLFGELRRLDRPKFRRYVTGDEIDLYLRVLADLAEIADDPPPPVRPICRDPDDEYLISLAKLAGVDALITGDRDLLELKLTDLTVLTPRQLVDLSPNM